MVTEKLSLTSSPQSVLTHAVLGLCASCSLQDFIDLVQGKEQRGGAITLLLCQAHSHRVPGPGLETPTGDSHG